jgi:hypothetical protein
MFMVKEMREMDERNGWKQGMHERKDEWMKGMDG